jgi:CRP-like cAMP-binding protein
VIERHIARLVARHTLSPAERETVRALIRETRTVDARTVVAAEGQLLSHSTLLLDGLMCRYKDLSDGQRQITEMHVPGDFADLHGFTLKRLDHHVMALTPCVIGIVPHDRVRALTDAHPRLTRIYWFSTNLDAAIHREWELSLGRRSADQRLAALLCELHVRLSLVGLADESGYDLALTQIDLSECLGLTSVHVNRVVRRLREAELATVRRGRVTLHDLPGLRALAEFTDDYLYLRPEDL